MKHVIITSSDAKYGNFLLNHWLRSLLENVQLYNTDVVVLDYGLNGDQRRRLSSAGIMVHPSLANGNITNIRYRDMARFLDGRSYDQVLSVDGGDIIFQGDISHLFDRDKSEFRGVCEERESRGVYGKEYFSVR